MLINRKVDDISGPFPARLIDATSTHNCFIKLDALMSDADIHRR